MAGSIDTVNGVTLNKVNGGSAKPSQIDGVDTASADSISVSPNTDVLGEFGGTATTQVTSSGAWTAAIIWDTLGLVNTFDSSGVDQDFADVVVDANEDTGTGDIRVRYTVGTANDDFDICIDGSEESCG